MSLNCSAFIQTNLHNGGKFGKTATAVKMCGLRVQGSQALFDR